MTQELTPNQRQFLIELRDISLRNKVIISGCGCCGSPFLEDKDEISPQGGYYSASGPSDSITWLQPLETDSRTGEEKENFRWKDRKSAIIFPDVAQATTCNPSEAVAAYLVINRIYLKAQERLDAPGQEFCLKEMDELWYSMTAGEIAHVEKLIHSPKPS